MKPRLFLAEDDVSIRQMLFFVLTQTCDFDVVGEAGDGLTALSECERLRPSVLITDLRMPRMDGIALLRHVRSRGLKVSVVVYTGVYSGPCIREAIQESPEGFVLKSDNLASLRQAVSSAAVGATFWSSEAGELRRQLTSAVRRFATITPAEAKVLRLIMRGKSTKEAAEMLQKSENTVSHQRQALMDKIGVHSAFALVDAARQAGFV